MSTRSKKEYAETLRLRYKKATRHEKTIILDEFCTTCGYHRKYAIRIFKPIRSYYVMHGRNSTKHGTLLRKQIPVKTNQWDESRPGFLEADTVAHCGTSTSGMFVYTVNFTRSRAYHKDDNAHIELKNLTHVRQWLGYDRLNNPNIVPLLNNLYSKEWTLFQNFFCSSVKLTLKERIASKTIKHHDSPKTPYQRIIDSIHISDFVKCSLSKQLEKLNPFLLRESIDKKLKKSSPLTAS